MKKLFSIPGSLAIAIIIAIAINLSLRIDGPLFWMNIMLAGFTCAKLMMALLMLKGQAQNVALGLQKKNLNFYAIKIFKMPLKPVLIFSLALLPPCAMLIISSRTTELDPATVRNIQSFAISMCSAFVVCFTHWAFHWQNYFFASEYETRVKLNNAGLSFEEAENFVETMRSNGFFGPVVCSIEGQARIE